jgi:hypothetical protein
VPPQAKACPECGSCEQTGWSERATYDRLELPAEDFDYEDFVKREFGPAQPKPRRIWWFWWAVAVAVLAAFLGLVLR